MNCRILLVTVLLAALVTAVPCRAQVEPALPSWNWDNPTADPTPWAPSTLNLFEIAALAVAVDLTFGGRVTGAIYRVVVGAGRAVFGGPAPAVAAARP